MPVTTMSSRQFDQHASHAKKVALEGPVFITDRGTPSHVLLNIDEYRKLAGSRSSIADALSLPGAEDIELPLLPMHDLARAADFS